MDVMVFLMGNFYAGLMEVFGDELMSRVVCIRRLFRMNQQNWVVVSKIFYFHPYLGKWSNLTNIFQMGWNHQLENFIVELPFIFNSWKLISLLFCGKKNHRSNHENWADSETVGPFWQGSKWIKWDWDESPTSGHICCQVPVDQTLNDINQLNRTEVS